MEVSACQGESMVMPPPRGTLTSFFLSLNPATDPHPWKPPAKEIEESPRESTSAPTANPCPRSLPNVSHVRHCPTDNFRRSDEASTMRRNRSKHMRRRRKGIGVQKTYALFVKKYYSNCYDSLLLHAGRWPAPRAPFHRRLQRWRGVASSGGLSLSHA
jgi:hypothetical protein